MTLKLWNLSEKDGKRLLHLIKKSSLYILLSEKESNWKHIDFVFKSLMLLKVLGDLADDDSHVIYISIVAALINTIVQLNKMILEAKQLDEYILDYL